MNDLLTSYVESRTVDATLGTTAGGLALTMCHDLPAPLDHVWDMIVDPALAASWSPVVADRRLDRVGPATSRETPGAEAVDAEVLASEAPRELAHRWDTDVLTWSLAPHDLDGSAGTRLTLRQELADPTEASSLAAGWHLCLAGLEARLGGHDVDRPVGHEAAGRYGWRQLRDGYDVLFAQQQH